MNNGNKGKRHKAQGSRYKVQGRKVSRDGPQVMFRGREFSYLQPATGHLKLTSCILQLKSKIEEVLKWLTKFMMR